MPGASSSSGSGNGSCFQVKLAGEWRDFDRGDDKLLKRAYLAGLPSAVLTLLGQEYEVSFRKMTQTNVRTRKERDIRPPLRSMPGMNPEPSVCITVPEDAPGSTIQVENPRDRRESITVRVPATAKSGQAMLVRPRQNCPVAEVEEKGKPTGSRWSSC
mmetsp:Transcript_97203/g.225342  ORF Transcript_97203/g.225342 Transcript_97203/m.225342 type:complete len:158 (+) Transcript_97203:110-583(+)